MTTAPPTRSHAAPTEPVEKANFEFEIPRFSATASQLVNELNGSNPKVSTVIQLIECEPTISSQVLRLANSPIYGASRAITTIGHAIVVLGFRSVAQQAIAGASGALFTDPNAPCATARLETYTQSLGVATAARFIAKHTKLANADEAFLCGVVHDVGKLILFEHGGEEYAELLSAHPQGLPLEQEIAAYGVCHASLGRECCLAWSLPNQMCNTIAKHHLPLDEAAEPLSQTLILATYLARKWMLGFSESEFFEDEIVEAALAEFQDEAMAAECREQFEAICEICMKS